MTILCLVKNFKTWSLNVVFMYINYIVKKKHIARFSAQRTFHDDGYRSLGRYLKRSKPINT